MLAFGQEEQTLSEYINWAVEAAGRLKGIEMLIEGDSEEEKAASFVKAMLDIGLAQKL